MNDILPPPSPTPTSIKTVQQSSRFTEHFDIVLPPAAFATLVDEAPPQRSMSISASSRPPTFAKPVRMHSSPAITMATSLDDTPKDNEPRPSKQQPIALLYKDYTPTQCLNRADMMIKRLGNWLVFFKLSATWLVEIQKMTASSAFKRLKKDHPERYDAIHKKRKEYQLILAHYKKECRDRIQSLKMNPALHMEELLLRANETRKRMAHLSKLCEMDSHRLPELDPWLANLQVLRYLKRETTEENRLRALMVPIQQDIQALESKLTEAFADLVSFCVEQETTVTQYGTDLHQVLGNFLPQHTWSAFVAAQQKEWVDEDHIEKNYLHINYPNKQHTHVSTVKKGVLGRRSGVLKHYHDKYFVLTHYGYLHQFKLEDKVKPETSIDVIAAMIQPPVFDDLVLEDHPEEHTFDIQTKRKTCHLKTTTGSELVSWCRALTNVANGSSVDKLLAQRKQRLASKQHYSNSTSSSQQVDDDDDDFHSIHDDDDLDPPLPLDLHGRRPTYQANLNLMAPS